MCAEMHRNSSADQAVPRSYLPARHVVKVLLSLSASILRLFRKRRGLRHGARDCGAFPSLLKSARDRSSVWEIRFDRADRAERAHERSVFPLARGGASLSRLPAIFLSRCPTSADPRGRTILCSLVGKVARIPERNVTLVTLTRQRDLSPRLRESSSIVNRLSTWNLGNCVNFRAAENGTLMSR